MATLLLIEDSPTERARIRALVEEAGLFRTVIEADDGLGGIKVLLSEPVDFVLTDLEMPNAGGEKVLAIRNSLDIGIGKQSGQCCHHARHGGDSGLLHAAGHLVV